MCWPIKSLHKHSQRGVREKKIRENDDGGVEVGDGGERGGAGDAEGEDGEATDAASDEVGVLGTVVENENQVRFHVFGVHFFCLGRE